LTSPAAAVAQPTSAPPMLPTTVKPSTAPVAVPYRIQSAPISSSFSMSNCPAKSGTPSPFRSPTGQCA
jgi:hypothetical protein